MKVYLVGCGANIDRCARLCDAFLVPIAYVDCAHQPSMTVQKRIVIPWAVEEDYPVGRKVLALTPQVSATPLNLVDWTGIENILLGNEKSGLSQDAIDASVAAHIPTLGGWHSLTIEQSLSIALWDWYLWGGRARGFRP
mgnify:FL=1